ncbi:hypothetical protein [Lysinibacillus sp. 54212]|uniref:hypothetical protein n=1 Tax=Lysinibacillus sp. 54212 TaxID=3119829 RepID=UPI002FC62574
MKYVGYVFACLPVAFLFHYYEYGQHLKGEGASFLFTVWLGYIIFIGVLSVKMKNVYIVGLNVISCLLSLLLASLLLINDGSWFIPFGRDIAILWIAVLTLILQLTVKCFVKYVWISSE